MGGADLTEVGPRGPAPPRATGLPAWQVFGALGFAATGVFLLLPAGGAAQAWLMVVVNAAATTALAVGIRRHRPEAGPAWRILLAAQVVYTLATAVWYVYPVVLGGALSYPSLLDPIYWLAYLGWAAFLFLLSRHRTQADRHIAFDAVIAAAALAVAGWELLLEPVVRAGLSTTALVASTVSPVLLLLLACLALRIMLSSGSPRVIDSLVVLWMVAELTGDVWHSLAGARGTFSYGTPWFAAWMVSSTLLGMVALRPDMRLLGQTREPVRPVDRRLRLLLLASSLAVPIAALAVHAAKPQGVEAYLLGAVTLGMVGLILTRLHLLSGDLETERALRADLVRLSAELTHASLHDPLTGLANREAFDQAVARATVQRQEQGRSTALLLVDLNSFKAVNDTYGHSVGDGLLRLTSARLGELVRGSDLVARIDGDEFAVIFEAVDVRAALLLAERLVAAVTEPAEIQGTQVQPAVSIGVHVIEPGQTGKEALICADAALYAAKTSGSDFELFDSNRHRQFIDRYQLELELRAAPANGGLVLHYQPILDLATRRVVAVESLIRWNHPTRGFLGPVEFIDMAEDSGAIIDVGRWVLRQACTDAAAWQRGTAGGAGVAVAVNVSRRQLSSLTLVDDVGEALHTAGLDPDLLTLEVTETSLNADTGEMVAILTKLRAIGVETAMDDFGTGYSSLAQLRSLPIDVLKIDKAFVDGIAREDQEWALAAAIIRLAATLGKRTLAEGIERASQLAHLRSLGCELGQGYLFARPMPLDDLKAYLADRADG